MAANLVGFNPYIVKIGIGKKILQFNLSNSLIEFRAIPVSGITYISNISFKRIKPKLIFMYLGGPLVNCFLFFILSIIYTFSLSVDNINYQQIIKTLAKIELIMFVGNLIPIESQEDGRTTYSDGKQVIDALTKSNQQLIKENLDLSRYASNQDIYPNNLFNNDSKKLHILWKAKIQLEQKNFEKAIKLLESLLDYPHILKRDKLYLLEILASIVINYGEMKYLKKADLWTEQALVLGNDIKTIQGTRGAILIEMGRYNEGKEMLLPLTEAGNTATDIAISSCYIAKADYFLGNKDKVKYWLKKAEGVGVQKHIQLRIQREINCFI